MYSSYTQTHCVSPLSITDEYDSFSGSHTVDPSFVMNSFLTPTFQSLDDCSSLYFNYSSPFNNTESPLSLSYVHPLQILSPTTYDPLFLLPLPTEGSQEPPFNSQETDKTQTEDGLKAESPSSGRELSSEDEEDISTVYTADDDSYAGEQDNDSDWERPKRISKKSKVPSGSKKRKRSSPVLIETDSQCSYCQTKNTSLWRRSPKGEVLCNACGLYLKLHGVIRPLSLKSDVIKRRNRAGSCKPYSRKSKKQKSSTL
ncbi:hypothetical protein BY458DRAFT_510696 [Sporodiniella umbellata]|nr:hypothetical protein BY458DRAFT_510696 [Sporodiniella umbellata]